MKRSLISNIAQVHDILGRIRANKNVTTKAEAAGMLNLVYPFIKDSLNAIQAAGAPNEAKAITVRLPSTGKRRGRPPKSVSVATVPLIKRKPGRPKKVVTAVTPKVTLSKNGKRMGRPPKNSTATLVVNEVPSISQTD